MGDELFHQHPRALIFFAIKKALRTLRSAFCYARGVIYLFHGSDSEKVRRQAFAFVEAARKKQSELTYVRFAREELSQPVLEEAAAGNSLFAKRLLVLLDDPFPKARATDNEEGGEEVISSLVEDNLVLLASSNNVVVILAPKLLAAKAKKIITKAEKEYKFDKAAAREAARGFNGNLVNALGARDSGKLWLEVARALKAGDAPEAVHGLLHWKARDELAKRPTPAARVLSLQLISVLMQSRRTGADLGESLERFALSIS